MSVISGGATKRANLFSQEKVQQSVQSLKKDREGREAVEKVRQRVTARLALRAYAAESSRFSQFSRDIVTVTIVPQQQYRGKVRLNGGFIEMNSDNDVQLSFPLTSVSGYKKECFKLGQLLEGQWEGGVQCVIRSFLNPRERANLKYVSNATLQNYLGKMGPAGTDVRLAAKNISTLIANKRERGDGREADRLFKNLLTYLTIKAKDDIGLYDVIIDTIYALETNNFERDRLIDSHVLRPLFHINDGVAENDFTMDLDLQTPHLSRHLNHKPVYLKRLLEFITQDHLSGRKYAKLSKFVLQPLSSGLDKYPSNLGKISNITLNHVHDVETRDDFYMQFVLDPMCKYFFHATTEKVNTVKVDAVINAIKCNISDRNKVKAFVLYPVKELSLKLRESLDFFDKLIDIINQHIPEEDRDEVFGEYLLVKLNKGLNKNPKYFRAIHHVIDNHISIQNKAAYRDKYAPLPSDFQASINDGG